MGARAAGAAKRGRLLATLAVAAVVWGVVAAAPAAGFEGRSFEPGYAMSKQYVAVTVYKILRDHAPGTISGCESDVKNEPDRFDDLDAAGAFTRGSINCLDKLGYLSGLPGGSTSSFEPGYAMSKQYVAVTVYKILRDHAPGTISGCEPDVKNEPDRFDDLGAAGAFTRGSINCPRQARLPQWPAGNYATAHSRVRARAKGPEWSASPDRRRGQRPSARGRHRGRGNCDRHRQRRQPDLGCRAGTVCRRHQVHGRSL